jgi:uncharacterized membrane protein
VAGSLVSVLALAFSITIVSLQLAVARRFAWRADPATS